MRYRDVLVLRSRASACSFSIAMLDNVRLNTLITDGKTTFRCIVQDVPRDRFLEELTFPNFDINAYTELITELTFIKVSSTFVI